MAGRRPALPVTRETSNAAARSEGARPAIAAMQNTNLAVVAPGIAEALLATAMGLVAAIPSVILYNKLSTDLARLAGRLEGFSAEFSAILSRQAEGAGRVKAGA